MQAQTAYQKAKLAFDRLVAFTKGHSLEHQNLAELEALRRRVRAGVLSHRPESSAYPISSPWLREETGALRGECPRLEKAFNLNPFRVQYGCYWSPCDDGSHFSSLDRPP